MTKLRSLPAASCARAFSHKWRMPLLGAAFMVLGTFSSGSHAAPLTWTVAYDQTSATTNGMRSLAVAEQSGNQSVYFGFIQTSGNRDVLRLDSNSPYSFLNDRNPQDGFDQPKAITTDDRGNVFIGNRESGGNNAIINTHDATLVEQSSVSVAPFQFGGLDSWKNSGNYYLYASAETNGEIRRYNINTATAPTLDNTFDSDGLFTIPGGGVLRGIEVASDGTFYVANRDLGKVFKVSADLSTITEASVPRAMDVDLYGGKLYVTSYNGTNSLIRILDAGTLAVADPDIVVADTGTTRGSSEGWAGIDISPDGRIFLTDHYYHTSGTPKDRLLVSSAIPEPSSIVLGTLGALGLLVAAYRRRSR